MKSQFTCNTCVGTDGAPLSTCNVRDTCPDDASTTEKRPEILQEIVVSVEGETE